MRAVSIAERLPLESRLVAPSTRRADVVAVTVVIPTLDESPRILDAIRSVSWADEIIVVDGGSADDTVRLAANAGATVRVLRGRTIGAQRNVGIVAARNHWILALDADEEATPELRDNIASICSTRGPGPTAYRIRSRNWHLGRELRHGPWGRDWKTRLFSRDHRFTDARVHEHVEAVGPIGFVDGTLIHHPYRDLAHHVSKVAKYARWAAEDMRATGRRAGASDLLVRPSWRFARDYAVLGGWRDGAAGFVVAVVSAFSVFCKYASLLTNNDAPGADGAPAMAGARDRRA